MKELTDPLMDAEDTPDLRVAFARHHALIVGVDSYFDPRIGSLRTAVNDARKVADVLHREHGFAAADLTLLCNADATRERVLHELGEAMPKRVGESDRLFVYLACHGLTIERDQGPQGHLLLHDACYEEPETFLPMAELDELLSRLSCRHTLMVLDCCFAGAFRWTTRNFLVRKRPLYREHFDYYVRSKSWHAIASAAYDETAADVYRDLRGREGDHSPFARALLDGLKGEADSNGDGFITSCELLAFIDGRMRTCGAKPQTPEMFPLRKHQRGYFLFQHPDPLRRRPLEAAPEFQPHCNPYRGLESFGEQEQDRFFGRQQATEKLCEAVRQRTLTVVLAPSGLGKSSLVKAGLIPMLRREGWHIGEVVRLGEHPLRSLEDALASNRTSRTSLPPAHAAAPSVLVLDQLEEVFTLCREKAERDAFLERLEALLECKAAPKIVATLRSDFESLFAEGPLKAHWTEARFLVDPMSREELEEAVRRPAELHALYFDPPRLVDDLINEVQQRPAALPMLSFALQRLYLQAVSAHPDDRALRQEDYKAVGGLAGAIREAAEHEYSELLKRNLQYASTVRNVMLRMASNEGGAPTRRRVERSELVYADGPENERVLVTIDAFIKARLLVPVDGDPNLGEAVEPAHDILVRGWGRLRAWLDEAAGDLTKQQEARATAVRWLKAGKSPKYLWPDDPHLPSLAEKLVSAPGLLNELESDFVRRSVKQAHNRKTRSQRVTAAVIVALSTLTLVAGHQAYRQTLATETAVKAQTKARDKEDDARNAATNESRQRVLAQQQESRALEQTLYAFKQSDFAAEQAMRAEQAAEEASKAQTKSESEERKAKHSEAAAKGNQATVMARQATGLDSALDVALGAARPRATELAGDHDELWGALFETVYRSTAKQSYAPPGHKRNGVEPDPLRNVWFLDEGAFLTASEGGTILRWAIGSNAAPTRLGGSQAGRLFRAQAADVSPDGALIVTADANGAIQLWRTRETETPFKSSPCSVGYGAHSIRLSPDSQFVAAADEDSVCLWNQSSGLHKILLLRTERKQSAATKAAAETSDGRSYLSHLAFSPRGDLLITATADGVTLWNVPDMVATMPVGRMLEHKKPVRHVAFAADARSIATSDDEGTVRIWTYDSSAKARTAEARVGVDATVLPAHTAPVTVSSFSKDGKRLLTACDDGSARLWDMASKQTLATFGGHPGPVKAARFSPDETTVLTTSTDGTARIWSVESGRLIKTLEGHEAKEIGAAAFSPRDGRQVLTGGEDGVALLWSLPFQGTPHLRLEHPGEAEVTAFVFSSNGQTLATGTKLGVLRHWNARSGRLSSTCPRIHRDSKAVKGLSSSPDGRFIVSRAADGEAFVWDTKTGHVEGLNDRSGPESAVQAAQFVDADHVAIFDGQRVHRARLTKVTESSFAIEHLSVPALPVAVSALDFDFDSIPSAATPTAGRTSLRAATGDGPSLELDVAPAALSVVRLSPNRQLAFTVDAKHEARLWKRNATFSALALGSTGLKPSPLFSARGSFLLFFDESDSTQLWHLSSARSPQPLGRLRQANAARGASFTPDERRLALLDQEGTLTLWRLETKPSDEASRPSPSTQVPERIAEFSTGHASRNNAVLIAPTGDRLAASAGDEVWLFSLDPCELLDAAQTLTRSAGGRTPCSTKLFTVNQIARPRAPARRPAPHRLATEVRPAPGSTPSPGRDRRRKLPSSHQL